MKKISYIDHWEEWDQEFHFYHPVKVRFSETDMFGHLNNTVPFIYFEEARIEFLTHIGLMEGWLENENESIPVVADLQCDFLEQVYFGETLHIYVKANEVGNSSCDIHYKGVRSDGKIGFIGRGTLVQISKVTGKALPLSEGSKKKLEQGKYSRQK
ncbi:acyl-CoA thioester hydrolase [Bacillus ectoiniformans]|uniref:acyl-CoA thioesterase n=1 Tax=Bacillus ectoiniformans TaxID=1494429 RepID=UPI001959CC3A|nr:acyl-CoA thioesterase [Bacillus ectoiniformans]MBM7648901.1 acyl-CoA thioester hydrolase [Bacillus ectoiniformans]